MAKYIKLSDAVELPRSAQHAREFVAFIKSNCGDGGRSMTPEEIVKALRCCGYGGLCTRCPVVRNKSCTSVMHKSAADLIERLEKEKAALLESIRGGCGSCKHWSDDTIECKIFEGCASCREDCECKGCESGENWEWKGLEDT